MIPATIFTYTFGIVACLVVGTGMSFAMQAIGNGRSAIITDEYLHPYLSYYLAKKAKYLRYFAFFVFVGSFYIEMAKTLEIYEK